MVLCDKCGKRYAHELFYCEYHTEGNCKGCGVATKWFISGDYPICQGCMFNLFVKLKEMLENGELKGVEQFFEGYVEVSEETSHNEHYTKGEKSE